MSDKPEESAVTNSDADDVEELDDELIEEDDSAPPDITALTPGPDAVADPYHAVMLLDDDGNNTGNLWTFDGKIMLFESLNAAKKVHAALEATDQHWVLRGVTQAHLSALEGVAAHAKIPLFVVVGFTPKGKIEAMPLEVHDKMAAAAGTPPPLPPKGPEADGADGDGDDDDRGDDDADDAGDEDDAGDGDDDAGDDDAGDDDDGGDDDGGDDSQDEKS